MCEFTAATSSGPTARSWRASSAWRLARSIWACSSVSLSGCALALGQGSSAGVWVESQAEVKRQDGTESPDERPGLPGQLPKKKAP